MDYLAKGLKPGETYTVQVRSKDNSTYSPWSPTFTFTVALPPAPTQTPTVTLSAKSLGYIVTVSNSATVNDFGGIKIYASASSGFTPGPGNLVATALESSVTINNASFAPVYVRVSFIDAWGQEGPTSVQQSVTPINPVITDIAAPTAPSGLTVAQISVASGAAGSINGIISKVQARWNVPPVVNANGVMDIAGFRLRYGIAGALPSVTDVPSTPVIPTTKQHAGTAASLTFTYHPFKVGDYVNVALTTPDALYDGLVLITGVTGTTGIVYTLGSSTSGPSATTGYVIQNSVVLENVRPNISYDYSVNAYDEQFNLSAFTATTSYTATAVAALDTSGLFKLGVGVSGANDGLFLNTNNYWFSGGAFSIGSGSGSSGAVVWDGVSFRIDGKLTARSGTFNGNVEIQNGGTLFAQGGSAAPGVPAAIGTGQRVVLNYTGIQGFDSGNNAVFTLPTTGSAAIGPWTFSLSKLSGGAGASEVGLAVTGASSFWAGGTQSGAPFRVTATGALYASQASISGNITASSGTIAGVSIITAFPSLPNGNFESAIDTGADNWSSFWKGAGATATRAAGEGAGGTYAYKVEIPSTQGSTLEWAATIPVVPGEIYTVTADIKSSSALTNSIVIGVLSGPTQAHTAFFDPLANWSATNYTISNVTTSFVTYTKAYTVPAGVYFIKPVVQMGMEGTASIRTFWVDNVTLTRSGSFNALVSGTGLPGSGTMKFMISDSGIISTTSKMAAIPGKFAVQGEVNATSIEASSMRAVEYKTTAEVFIPGSQTIYAVTPDAGSGLGTTFYAPVSGKVLVIVSAICKARTSYTAVSYEIRTGGTLGSGTVVQAASTENCAYFTGSASGATGGAGSANTNYIDGLTPNAQYNVRFMHVNGNVSDQSVQYRKLTIIPQP